MYSIQNQMSDNQEVNTNIFHLPALLLIDFDGSLNGIHINTNNDLKMYTRTLRDITIDVDLQIVETGVKIDVKISDNKNDNCNTKIQKEIGNLNSLMNQLATAVASSMKDLLKAGREH